MHNAFFGGFQNLYSGPSVIFGPRVWHFVIMPQTHEEFRLIKDVVEFDRFFVEEFPYLAAPYKLELIFAAGYGTSVVQCRRYLIDRPFPVWSDEFVQASIV